MLAAFRMVDRRQLAFHLRATRFDAGVVLATALAAVFISVEFCVVIGVFLSFVLYLPRAARVRLTQLVHTPDGGVRERASGEQACDRLLLFRLEGELFFGAEPELKEHLAAVERAARDGAGAVVLLLERARNPDAAFLSLLDALEVSLRGRGVALLLGGVEPDLGRGLARSGLAARIGAGRIVEGRPGHDAGWREVVHSAYRVLGDALCSGCPRRPSAGAGRPLNHADESGRPLGTRAGAPEQAT